MKHEVQWCDVFSDKEVGRDDSVHSGAKSEGMRKTVLMSVTVCQLTIQELSDNDKSL